MESSLLIDCPNCQAQSYVEPLGQFENVNPYDWMDGQKYYFSRCPGCSQAILSRSTLTFDPEAEDTFWQPPSRIFPGSEFNVNVAIPRQIRHALMDSIKCYEASLYTPTVIMCRRTLEGFCHTMGIPRKVPLVKSLERLKNDGIINEQLFQWAILLKDSGNDAAHNISSEFSNEDAKDILDFTIAILDFSYSFKDKFDKFIARKKPNEPSADVG